MTRYITLVLGAAMIYGLNTFMNNYSAQLSVYVISAFVVLLCILFISIQTHMNKQYVLRFAR